MGFTGLKKSVNYFESQVTKFPKTQTLKKIYNLDLRFQYHSSYCVCSVFVHTGAFRRIFV